MALKIEWSDDALALLEDVVDYLLEEAGQLTATKILDKITHRIDILTSYPEIGQREPFLKGKRYEYRRLLEGHYKIIYRFDDDTVYITAIFDTRQNPDRLRTLIRE
jgi:plasmid stabilization system protein ParE